MGNRQSWCAHGGEKLAVREKQGQESVSSVIARTKERPPSPIGEQPKVTVSCVLKVVLKIKSRSLTLN